MSVLVIQVNEKDKRLQILEAKTVDLEAVSHDQLLKINGLELENSSLRNQIIRLESEINDFSQQIKLKKDSSLKEISSLIEEHKFEKEEWEKLRESTINSPIFQNARF